jgi:hypothetical protein
MTDVYEQAKAYRGKIATAYRQSTLNAVAKMMVNYDADEVFSPPYHELHIHVLAQMCETYIAGKFQPRDKLLDIISRLPTDGTEYDEAHASIAQLFGTHADTVIVRDHINSIGAFGNFSFLWHEVSTVMLSERLRIHSARTQSASVYAAQQYSEMFSTTLFHIGIEIEATDTEIYQARINMGTINAHGNTEDLSELLKALLVLVMEPLPLVPVGAIPVSKVCVTVNGIREFEGVRVELPGDVMFRIPKGYPLEKLCELYADRYSSCVDACFDESTLVGMRCFQADVMSQSESTFQETPINGYMVNEDSLRVRLYFRPMFFRISVCAIYDVAHVITDNQPWETTVTPGTSVQELIERHETEGHNFQFYKALPPELAERIGNLPLHSVEFIGTSHDFVLVAELDQLKPNGIDEDGTLYLRFFVECATCCGACGSICAAVCACDAVANPWLP